jgi:predicted ABC-type ATPase
VLKGGHSVPNDKLLARFSRTLANADKALALADLGVMLDNSLARQPYRWIETWENGVCTARAT